jgi:GNAT superfamily N-acetyltransferase
VSRVEIRDGGPADAPALLALLDEAVAWLVERGQTGQWGAEPFSARPKLVAQVEEWASSGGLRVAVDQSGTVLGALVVGDRLAYVPEVDEPETYIGLLVTSRRRRGEGIGSALVERALAEARAAGHALVRVDCWAGAPGLVAWYEEQGFRPVETFAVGEWPGQLFDLRLDGQQQV